MKRAYVDANVILRYLTKDPPEMGEKALKVFLEAKEGQIVLLITALTVAEIVWVLESFYGHPKSQISETLIQFLSSDGLEVEDLDLLIGALTLYHEKNIDFADAFLAAQGLRRGPSSIYSFDHHLKRVSGITVLNPV